MSTAVLLHCIDQCWVIETAFSLHNLMPNSIYAFIYNAITLVGHVFSVVKLKPSYCIGLYTIMNICKRIVFLGFTITHLFSKVIYGLKVKSKVKLIKLK